MFTNNNLKKPASQVWSIFLLKMYKRGAWSERFIWADRRRKNRCDSSQAKNLYE